MINVSDVNENYVEQEQDAFNSYVQDHNLVDNSFNSPVSSFSNFDSFDTSYDEVNNNLDNYQNTFNNNINNNFDGYNSYYEDSGGNIDSYGTPLTSVIVSDDDTSDFSESGHASADIPDQRNPGQYYNDDSGDVSKVLNNPPFRSEAVNKFLGHNNLY